MNMDVFSGNAFSTISLTGAVDKMDFVPSFLGGMGLFEPMPVRTKKIFIDRRDGTLTLIPTTPDGTPPPELKTDNRDAVSLETVRLAKSFTLWAHELAGLRPFGQELTLENVQAEYLRRLSRMRDDLEVTEEFHRLGALQGLLLDSDGSTVIYDYASEMGEAIPAATSFELDVTTTDVRGLCHALTRSMARSSRGAITNSTSIHALCGDSFYDAFIVHPNVEKTYLNWSAASDLRENKAHGSFVYGGITWHNYRGTDDNSTVAIPTAEAKFFPVGARGVFKKAMSPHPSMEYVNTLGQAAYSGNVLDRDRQMWTKGEVYAYPLYICQQPRVLRRATLT
jgi:hypothetical protein